ncbi:hypothetical protein L7F22_041845 [Adiantum nelumboides]|nr:hypothetical protein [Adiantum nelumboides]
MHLMKKLFNLCMKEKGTISTHINEFNIIFTWLTTQGLVFDEEIKCIFLLCSFPLSWDTACTAISNSVPGTSLVYNDILGSLFTKEICRKSLECKKDGDAYVASDRQRVHTQSCAKSKDRGGSSISLAQSKKDRQSSEEFKSQKSDDSNKGKEKLEEINVTESPNAPTIEILPMADMPLAFDLLVFITDLPIEDLVTQDAQYAHNWIVDSGANFHVTPHREWFSSYSHSHGKVRLGDVYEVDIKGVKNVKLYLKNGTQFTLCNVRHVPKLTKSLISVSQLDDLGYNTTFDNDLWMVHKGNLMRFEYPKLARFYQTQEDFAEVHRLSQSGKLWKHLSTSDLPESEWLIVFDTPKYKGSKIFLNMVKPQFVDKCRLLFYRVYQEPPINNEIYLKFATCFIYERCSAVKANSEAHKIAWALFAENVILSLKRNLVAWKRKVDAFRDMHGPINVITRGDFMPGPSMQADVKGRLEPCFMSSVIKKLHAKILDIQSNKKAKVLKNELKEKKAEFLNKRDALIRWEATTSATSMIQTKITSLQTRYGTLKGENATAEQLADVEAQSIAMSNAVKLIEGDDKIADMKIVVESIEGKNGRPEDCATKWVNGEPTHQGWIMEMGREISEIFVSTIGVKQGCPLSPTLFGLCIDQLEQMVFDFMQEEGIEEVTICNAVIMLLLYADDVVLLAHTLEDAQKLMVVLEKFCLHSGLIVNESKTKVMLVKTNHKEKPCIVYNNETLEVVESFKYLGLEVPSNHKWHECAMRRLEVGKRAYYAFENMCNAGNIKCWVLKKYLFDALVTPVLLYGIEVWGGSISKSTWKEFENVQKRFLTNFLQVKTQTPYMLLLLESGSLPIEVMGMERVVEYMIKMRLNPSHRLPTIAWEASKKVQKTHKSKILSLGWMQDIKKWFGRWDALHLLHDASIDSQVNGAFLQRQCITAWEKSECGVPEEVIVEEREEHRAAGDAQANLIEEMECMREEAEVTVSIVGEDVPIAKPPVEAKVPSNTMVDLRQKMEESEVEISPKATDNVASNAHANILEEVMGNQRATIPRDTPLADTQRGFQ